MKKVLALMFALALTVSMSSFAFAHDDAKAGDKMDKPADSKDKKAAKKKGAKKDKKSDEKKDDAKKDK
jgi:hypothetical protein